MAIEWATIIADNLIGYLLDQSGLGEALRNALRRDPQKQAFKHALIHACEQFEQQSPEAAASLFNLDFFKKEGGPIIEQFLIRDGRPDPADLFQRPRWQFVAVAGISARTETVWTELLTESGEPMSSSFEPGKAKNTPGNTTIHSRDLKEQPGRWQHSTRKVLALLAIISVQMGAAVGKGLFSAIGPLGTTFLRLGFAAVMLLLLWRPQERGLTRAQYINVLLFGIVLAAMNGVFYSAIRFIHHQERQYRITCMPFLRTTPSAALVARDHWCEVR